MVVEQEGMALRNAFCICRPCARAQKRMTLKATLRTTKRALQVETRSRKEIRSASYAASDFTKTGLHLRRTPRIEPTAYAESALPLFRRLWKFQVGANHLEHSLGFCLDFERLSLWNCEVHNVNCNWRLFNRATGTLICIIFIVSIVLTWQLEILLTYRTYLSHTSFVLVTRLASRFPRKIIVQKFWPPFAGSRLKAVPISWRKKHTFH